MLQLRGRNLTVGELHYRLGEMYLIAINSVLIIDVSVCHGGWLLVLLLGWTRHDIALRAAT